MRPRRLLDLFCGAGGAGMGYRLAGFDVVGVDIESQPNYPFEFWRTDALEVLGHGGVGPWLLEDFSAIHASPPCQMYSKALKHMSSPQPMLIEDVREQLQRIGLPWVIENVVGAPLPKQSDIFGNHGIELCGTMFGLPTYRHRLFECSFSVPLPRPCNHSEPAMNPHNQAGRDRIYAEFGRGDPDPVWNGAMGIGWMGKEEGREAIPPAMTQYVGRYLYLACRPRRMEDAA